MQDRIKAVARELEALTVQVQGNEQASKMLTEACQQAINAVTPGPAVIWKMMMQPHQNASLRVALELGLVEALIASDGPKSASELANVVRADQLLIVRILRPLVAMGIFIETGVETYKAGKVAHAFASPPLVAGFKCMFDGAAFSCIKLPEFLSQTGFKNPEGPQGSFQYAHNSPLPTFEWLQQHPKQLTDFNVFMAGQRNSRVDWFDAFPVQDVLFHGFQRNNDEVLLVDIAGGRGHDLEAFRKRFPDAFGKLILEDLPAAIDEIEDLDESILRMKYDFFTPQPVIGARAYYFRAIFHNWTDRKCRDILQNVVKAMKPGYSKLLINEWVLPEVGVPLYPALLDINMMALFSGMQRTQSQWKNLLESVGLKIVKFWSIGPEVEGLIEAVVEQEQSVA